MVRVAKFTLRGYAHVNAACEEVGHTTALMGITCFENVKSNDTKQRWVPPRGPFSRFFLEPERCFALAGFGRGRTALVQTAGALRSLEQEEPFDLSQKRGAKAPAFQSDGESARGSSCHEEEDEDNCYEMERDSPGQGPQGRPLCAPQDLSSQPKRAPRVPGAACGEEEDLPKGGRQEQSKDSRGPEGGLQREFACRDQCLGLRALQSTRRPTPCSEDLYFKHSDESLKELLERKMEKQAVLLGI